MTLASFDWKYRSQPPNPPIKVKFSWRMRRFLNTMPWRSMEPIAGGSVCNDPYTRMELSSLEEGRKEQIWQAKRGQGGSRQIGSHIHPQSDLVEVLLLHPECRHCKIVGLGERLSILLFWQPFQQKETMRDCIQQRGPLLLVPNSWFQNFWIACSDIDVTGVMLS